MTTSGSVRLLSRQRYYRVTTICLAKRTSSQTWVQGSLVADVGWQFLLPFYLDELFVIISDAAGIED